MKKNLRLPVIIVFVVVIALILPAILDIANVPVSKDDKEVLITIEDNTSIFGIAKILDDKSLIRSSVGFIAKVKLGKYNGKLTSGTYTLSPSMSVEEICAKLSEPKILRETATVTFPEGFSLEQMAKRLEEEGLVSEEAFLKAADEEYDFEFLKNIPKGDYNYRLQGFLFPDTYEFYKDSTAGEIIEKMLARFDEVYSSSGATYDDVFEIITKASMIEKEAKVESERPMIAGVIENRISKGMAFQIDATVLYDATNGLYDEQESTFIAKNIRELDSPYNTYMFGGLPAGPICNPGITSIKAALEPATHNYLYYHTDTKKNDGSHIFTETFNQHINTMK